MGSFDGCEICELVGLHIIDTLRKEHPDINFGLYRDDGLGALKRTPKTKLEKLKKDLFELFNDKFGLKITLDTDLTVVNFLDVTFDLHNDRYYPFRKPNDTPLYIHKHSNHPPHVTKQLPNGINKRLNDISSSEELFNTAKSDYEEALSRSLLQSKLTYKPTETNTQNAAAKKAKKSRKRHVIWFTPPYNAALITNIGKEFLKIIDKNFPNNHHLHRILNRKTIKVSYSCTPSMGTILSAHNASILVPEKNDPNANCNCQNKNICPVPGECCRSNVVYQAEVQHNDGSTAQYIGCTEPPFKQRYRNHKKSFTHETYKTETTLSRHVWDKNLNPSPKIKWKFLKVCNTYQPSKKSCDLCLSEKFYIIKNMNKKENINKRTDIGNKCPHKRKRTFAFAGD